MSREKNLIPELRFPEFVKDGEWEKDALGNRGNFTGGGTPNKENPTFWQGDIPWISSSDISEESIQHIDKTRFITKDAIKNSATKIVPENSLLIVSRVGVGKVAVVKEEICTSQDFTNFTPFKDDIVFLGYYLKSCEKILHGFSQGMAIKGFTKDDIVNFNLPFPDSLKEQKKIASCLSSLDELITTHSQKLKLLKDHKKGLVQNFFPQEGQKVPNYRFAEFEKGGEWKTRKVEEFFDVGSSKRVLQKDWTNNGVPFYRTRELVSLSKKEPFGSETYIAEELYSELKETYGTPTEGDFLVSGVGTLGIIYQVQEGDKFYFKDGNVLWFKKSRDLNSSYFRFCFESAHIQNQISAQTSKSTVGTYTIKNARITEFWHPPSKEEQKKIASCLSAVDELITVQAEKIEQLQQHKKGLMQGLFPKI